MHRMEVERGMDVRETGTWRYIHHILGCHTAGGTVVEKRKQLGIARKKGVRHSAVIIICYFHIKMQR